MLCSSDSGSGSGTGFVNPICGLLIAAFNCADRSPATTRLGSPTPIAVEQASQQTICTGGCPGTVIVLVKCKAS